MFTATKTPEIKLEEAETTALENLGIERKTYIKWKQNTEQQALSLEAKLTHLESKFPHEDKITHAKKMLQQRVIYNAHIRLKDLEKQMRNELYQAAHAAYYHEIPSNILPGFFNPQKLDKTFSNIRKFNVAFDDIAIIEGVGETAELKIIPLEEGKSSQGMHLTLDELFNYTKCKLNTREYSDLFPLSKITLDAAQLKAKYASEMKIFFEKIFPEQLRETAEIAALYENKLKSSALPPRVPRRMVM